MTLSDSLCHQNIRLANRLVLPPMAMWKRKENGEIPNELSEHYAARSGKIGLIILEFSFISEEGKSHPAQLSIASDADIPKLKKLADAIHQKGITAVYAQINHGGAKSGYEVGNQADIDRIVKAFALSAQRAQKAGFDGVEIHAAHGYLLTQFYSPITNARTDGYGPGNVASRARLTVEVIKAVREAVGQDFPISVRFGGCDYREGGSTIEDAAKAAVLYEQAGADLISISGGLCGYIIKENTAPGWFSDLSHAVKKAVSVPVLLTGGITDRETADRLLSEGKADLIGVGRPILADASVIDSLLD